MYGGLEEEKAYSLLRNADGAYVLAGTGKVADSVNEVASLLKTDSLGNLIWERVLNNGLDDFGYSVQQTLDGGYIVGSNTATNARLTRTDSLGFVLWRKEFRSAGAFTEYIPVGRTADGGYVTTGMPQLIKTDSLGNEEWEKSDYDRVMGVTSLQQTRDHGYVLVGAAMSATDSDDADVCLLKTDSLGNSQWMRTSGGANRDEAYWVQQTSDQGYVACGETDSYGRAEGDVYIVRTDSAGNVGWTKTLGLWGEGHCIQQTMDGGFVIAGLLYDSTTDKQLMFLAKLAQESK
jgi:hypothetical protein